MSYALEHFHEFPLYLQLGIIVWFILLVSLLFILLDIGKRVWYNTRAGRRARRRYLDAPLRGKGKF